MHPAPACKHVLVLVHPVESLTFICSPNNHRDYRDIPTNVGVKYNKISCIEMAEHVGIKNFQTFLLQVYELLEDDGTFLLQIAGLRRAFQVRSLLTKFQP